MIKLVTWNICFKPKYMEQRYREILRLVSEYNPDICCFQEVIPEFVQIMSETTGWFDNYDFSDLDIHPYGTLMCAKKYLEFNFKSYELTSRMGRKLIIGSNPDLIVGTVHLESLDSESIRLTQLKEIKEVFVSYDLANQTNKILCGDFNFCSESNYIKSNLRLENSNMVSIFPGWKDEWANSPKTWTWKSMRLDRVLTRLNPGLVSNVETKRLLGTSPLQRMAHTYPSDHFGLGIEFV